MDLKYFPFSQFLFSYQVMWSQCFNAQRKIVNLQFISKKNRSIDIYSAIKYDFEWEKSRNREY